MRRAVVPRRISGVALAGMTYDAGEAAATPCNVTPRGCTCSAVPSRTSSGLWRGPQRVAPEGQMKIAQRFIACRFSPRDGVRLRVRLAARAGGRATFAQRLRVLRGIPGRSNSPSQSKRGFGAGHSTAQTPQTAFNALSARNFPRVATSFIMLNAVHAHNHSVRTLSKPRSRNCRSPIVCLMTALGVSARCARRA